MFCSINVVAVQSLRQFTLFVMPQTETLQVPLSFTISGSLLIFMSTDSMMLCKHFILCQPLLLLPSVFPQIRVFSNESDLHLRWPKFWNFSICPSNEYSGLISCRHDWFNLLAVQSLLQHYNSKPSILQRSVFFMVQLSHPYRTNGKSMKVKVAQLGLTLCDPMDCSPPGSSIHGIFQDKNLEWVAISFSRGSSWPRDQTHVSLIVGRLFTI